MSRFRAVQDTCIPVGTGLWLTDNKETKGGIMAKMDSSLPFERRIIELEGLVANASSDKERRELQAELDQERETVFANLTAWQRVLLARHPLRPRMLDYTSRILDDFIELHGDRAVGDDPALVAGIGRFQGQSLVVVGQQKGVTTEEKVQRNFGMAHPEGYRKALRLFHMAERLNMPVVTLVDTPAAHPGVEAERHGQGPLIAQSLLECSGLKAPVFVAILSEGGSGGALAIALGDWVAMLEYAIYVICPPERCAEILWRDVDKREVAATALRVTAKDLLDLGTIDAIIPEPPGGAHRDPDSAAGVIAEELERFLAEWKKGKWTLARRRQRYRRMGMYRELPAKAAD